MRSLNPHYGTHIKYKHVRIHTHIHTLPVALLPKSPVSIKRVMNLALKLVLQSGATGRVTIHTQTGEERCVCLVCYVCVCVCVHDNQVPLRRIWRKCWPLEKHTWTHWLWLCWLCNSRRLLNRTCQKAKSKQRVGETGLRKKCFTIPEDKKPRQRQRKEIKRESAAVTCDPSRSLYLCSCFPSHTFRQSWTQWASHPSMPKRGYGLKPGFTQKQHGCPAHCPLRKHQWTEHVSFSLWA